IELKAFQRGAINQFMDAMNRPDLLQGRSQNYRRFVVDRILQFSGGHPRASIGLLQELENGWTPSRSLSRQQDLKVFEKHVERELNKFVEKLDPVCQTYLTHLTIFRSINFATLRVIEQKYELAGQQNPTQLMSTFRQCNLLHSHRDVPGIKTLNPIFRLGSLARLSLRNTEQYAKQHQFAQNTYQNWAASHRRSADDVIRCLGESIYHCLSRMEDQERLEEQAEFMNCLHYSIQILNHRETETMDSPRSILATILEDDEDSQALLQKLGVDWTRLLNFAFVSYTHTPIEEDAQHQKQTVRTQCKTMTLVLSNDTGDVSGTGFWVALNQQGYVVTCAHVLKQLQCAEGDSVTARTFGPNIQDLELEVLWYKVPHHQGDRDWSARQDVAILRPLATTSPETGLPDLLPLSTESMSINEYRQSATLYSFGYPAPKRLKGDSFSSLVFDEYVGNGFIKLLNLGATKVEGGVSGSPLCHLEGQQLVGMIHARLGADVVYCIPATTILEVLTDLQNSLSGSPDEGYR
ncbi:MAG: serine protease, partial [Cyanobacteria bacterium J06642_11]